MEGNFTFEIGEKALMGLDTEVTILAKALRPIDFANREQYLVEIKGFWRNKKKWVLQASLTTIIK